MNDFSLMDSSDEEVRAACAKRGLSDKKLNAYIEAQLGAGGASKLVCGVVGRTRLWRREKFDVACELIDHFQEAAEAGVDVEKAVADFGDVKEAAKMIRGAKVRCRSMAWKTRVWCWRGLSVFAVFYLVVAVRFWVGTATVETDYVAMINARAERVAEEDRAWPIYLEVSTEVRSYLDGLPRPWAHIQSWKSHVSNQRKNEAYALEFEKSDAVRFVDESPVAEYDAKLQSEYDEMKKMIVEHPQWTARLRAAAALPELGFVFKDAKAGEEISHVYYLASTSFHPYTVVNLLGWDAILAVEKGDAVRAYEDMIAVYSLVHQMAKQEMPLNSHLMALSLLNSNAAVIESILIDHPAIFTDEQLTGIAHLLATVDTVGLLVNEFDLLSQRDLLQRVYTLDDEGDGRLTYDGYEMLARMSYRNRKDSPYAYLMDHGDARAFSSGPLVGLGVAGRLEVRELSEAFYAEQMRYLTMPLWHRKNVEGEITKKLRRLSKREPWRYELVSPLFRSFGRAADVRDIAEARRSGALVGIALELYRRAEGGYPERIEDLVPRYLPVAPADLATGGAIGYVLREDGPVVYMVGEDGDDDGGRLTLNREGEPDAKYMYMWSAWSWGKGNWVPDGDWVLYPAAF